MMRLLPSLMIVLLLVGCRSPEGSERWPGSIRAYEEPGERFQPSAVRVAPPSAGLGEQEEEIARVIASRHEEMLDGNPADRVLAEAELVFLANGNLPDLLGYYEQALERGQTDPKLAGRVAWLYQRLGLDDLALEKARAAVAANPDDPFSHFALAFSLGQQSDRFDDPFHEVIDLLRVVFELEPTFEVAGVVSNGALRAELARLEHDHADHHPPAESPSVSEDAEL